MRGQDHEKILVVASPKSKPAVKSFQAKLERGDSRLNWVIIRIPFDVQKIWGTRAQMRVKGSINGFDFRTSLFPTGKGGHIMLVNKTMQKGARAEVGMIARFQLEPDTGERIITVPPELKRLLGEDRRLPAWFDRLNHSTRWWIVKWISQAKSAEARQRRAEQMAERLLATLEAERELPPVLRIQFARHPRAAEGWKLMSDTRRRSHLLGIFYYRTPAAQARRAAKAVQEAGILAEKRAK